MRALLIIDMQNESFVSMDAMFEGEAVITRIQTLAEAFRTKGDKVIFIQHDGSSEGCYIPHTEGWEILPALPVNPDDLVISKTANDAFYKTDLKQILDNLTITELVVTGCATDFCVDATVKAALVNDLPVTVLSNAHTTEDKPHLTAKQIIDHYNWIWSAMAQTKSAIQVVDFDIYTQATS
ncbi:cysteine hydrolase family protein [Cytophagaceae bacterium DM2B3-1]|uniref:Cysteine hydrolase family protein n=1 Tax=Xanthocytophaga flava TaxID=3048013 RepID=A0ABT7CY53_9BACT|nr:cysteine hydrolase family protein [Xanthocytophaga flavus]MDJ1498677.1 cysteine hydrolase family protein [Xanthocytophaga flavus]